MVPHQGDCVSWCVWRLQRVDAALHIVHAACKSSDEHGQDKTAWSNFHGSSSRRFVFGNIDNPSLYPLLDLLFNLPSYEKLGPSS